MEIRLLAFIGLVFLYAIINVCVFVGAYYYLRRATTKVTAAVSELEKNSEMRAWINSMQTAAAEAVAVTDATKRKMAEFEPMLAKAHETYSRTLAAVDSKLEVVAEDVSTNARKMRDVVAKPAFSVMGFVAGIAKVMETSKDEEH